MPGTIIGIVGAALVGNRAELGRTLFNSGNPPDPWRSIAYPGERPTRYRVAVVAGRLIVDLSQTPVLCWRWYVNHATVSGLLLMEAGAVRCDPQ